MAGPEAFARAQVYVREGHVTGLELDAERRIVSGRVKGSHHASYASSVQLAVGVDGPGQMPLHVHRGRCSCPVGVDCKHAAAVLIAARGLPALSGQLGRPEWERSLGRLAAAAEPVRDADEVSLGLEFDLEATPGYRDAAGAAASQGPPRPAGEQRPLGACRGGLGAAGLPGEWLSQRAARPAAATVGLGRCRSAIRLSAQPVARPVTGQPESLVGARASPRRRSRARFGGRHGGAGRQVPRRPGRARREGSAATTTSS